MRDVNDILIEQGIIEAPDPRAEAERYADAKLEQASYAARWMEGKVPQAARRCPNPHCQVGLRYEVTYIRCPLCGCKDVARDNDDPWGSQ